LLFTDSKQFRVDCVKIEDMVFGCC